jgi:secreted protein with Ig-like and vWFA domain
MSVAFHNILKYLRADDKITIVTYASKVDVEAVNWSVDKQSKAKIQELFNGFAYRGGTNIKAALSKAGQLSRKYKISGGNNRIIIVSDANFDVRGRMSDVSSIASNGIKVSVFCSQKKTPDQHKDLTELAKRGRGTYFNFAVGNSKSIEEAFWQELLGF